MTNFIDQYIEASGAKPEIREDFYSLVSEIPSISEDLYEAAIEVKEYLYNNGFSYDVESFTIDDVLKNKSGNCLGLPLLIGSILGEKGFEPRYQLAVNPREITFQQEKKHFERLNRNLPYGTPVLEKENEEYLAYRFAPLEHLVLDINGKLVETTSEEHDFPECESLRSISFEEALSCVYRDRNANETSKMRGEFDNRKKVLEEGLKLWPDNKRIYSSLAYTSILFFNDEGYENNKKKFIELKNEDSLSYFERYLLTGNLGDLEKSLEIYPCYAQAIECKAREVAGTNEKEARFLMSLASNLYASSNVLDLSDFYINNSELLAKFYFKDEVLETLESFSDEKCGDFDYNIGMFKLGRDETHLGEAFECVESPFQKLIFLNTAKGTEHYNEAEMKELDRKYGGSEIYQTLSKELNSLNV